MTLTSTEIINRICALLKQQHETTERRLIAIENKLDRLLIFAEQKTWEEIHEALKPEGDK